MEEEKINENEEYSSSEKLPKQEPKPFSIKEIPKTQAKKTATQKNIEMWYAS